MKKHILYPFLLSLLVLFLAGPVSAQSAVAIKQAVNDVLKSNGMDHASFAVSVYNISQKQTIYSYQAQQSLVPGSLAKLFTTAVGFEKLGSDFRFKTTLAYDGEIDLKGTLHGNLYIIGGGDPLLGSYRFRQTHPDTLFNTWTKAITNKGIKTIDGRIYFYTNIFDDKSQHDSWQWGDIGNYYGAGAHGLNFHENMYFVYFNAGKHIGYPASVDHIAPKNLNVREYNEVVTGEANSGDRVVIYGDPNGNIRRYCGTVPLGKNRFAVRGAMPSPGRSCAELFSNHLRANNINVSSNAAECTKVPDNVKTIIDYYSNTYYVIAQYTNQTSNNVYAESIFKYLGYQSFKKGSYHNSAKVIEQFFRTHNLNNEGVRIVDGCGLSCLNLVTTDFVCRFLNSVHGLGIYKDFSNSLAKVKESGTARNMLKDLPDNISVRLKSGSMDGVKAYAGYVVTSDNETLCFSVISNNHTCSDSEIKSKMEKVLRTIALYHK